MVKKGDTLIEVTLAVGIFSMIAIGITAVMSSGASDSQTALETTLAREEIDTQAEALRFIQSSYAVNKSPTDTNKYPDLWHAITANAINLGESGLSDNDKAAILQYAPNSCSDMYGSEKVSNAAFVINPRMLGAFTNGSITGTHPERSVYISRMDNASRFADATIYPHLIYGSSYYNNEDLNNLDGSITNNNLYRAEGIYVIAVKDSNANGKEGTGTTTLVDDSGVQTEQRAYYDFYIRTCWYGSDTNQPSTISTVIRLYDPDSIVSVAPQNEGSNSGSSDSGSSGSSSGSSTSPDPSDTPKTFIQDFDNSTCAAQASSNNYTVYDRRDNKAYNVRYAGGRCWMTSDLAISGTISSADSNFSNVSSWNLNTTSGRSYTQAVSSGSSYNFCAATASNGNGCTKDSAYYGDNDICPAGWRLPTSSEAQAVINDTSFVATIPTSSWENGYWTSTTSGTWGGEGYRDIEPDNSAMQLGFWRESATDNLTINYTLRMVPGNHIRCVRK